eukprot:g15382.t1
MLAADAANHVSSSVKPGAIGQVELPTLSNAIHRALKEYIATKSLLPVKHREKRGGAPAAGDHPESPEASESHPESPEASESHPESPEASEAHPGEAPKGKPGRRRKAKADVDDGERDSAGNDKADSVNPTAQEIAGEIVKGIQPLFDSLAKKEGDQTQFAQLKEIVDTGSKQLSGIRQLVEKQATTAAGSDSDESKASQSEQGGSPMQVLYAPSFPFTAQQYSQMAAMSLPMVQAPLNQFQAATPWQAFGVGQGVAMHQNSFFQLPATYQTPPHSRKSHHGTKRAGVHKSKHSTKKRKH